VGDFVTEFTLRKILYALYAASIRSYGRDPTMKSVYSGGYAKSGSSEMRL
jgi:hypothetical protein